jgi:hypothetical protein
MFHLLLIIFIAIFAIAVFFHVSFRFYCIYRNVCEFMSGFIEGCREEYTAIKKEK